MQNGGMEQRFTEMEGRMLCMAQEMDTVRQRKKLLEKEARARNGEDEIEGSHCCNVHMEDEDENSQEQPQEGKEKWRLLLGKHLA